MGCGASKEVGSSASSSGKKAKSYENASLSSFPTDVPKDVQELTLSENASLTSLDGIGEVTSLEKLDASGCGLAKIPDEIEKCTGLQELLLYKNKLKELTPKVGALKELGTLNIFNNVVKKLPEAMGELTNLEEVNAAANKLMMLTDKHFTGWAGVKILSLYDNNLVRMGSLAPLVALEELRISGNNLEEMPKLSSHPALTVYEIHKNRIAAIEEDYFTKTPALERLSVWSNQLSALPPSLLTCKKLLGVQAQGNALSALPAGAWPATLETLFVQDQKGTAFTLAPELAACLKLKRVNLSNLQLDAASLGTAEKLKETCGADKTGIFWGVDGVKLAA